MDENDRRHEIARRRVVYTLPGEDAVTVRRGVAYRATPEGALTMDVYSPPGPPAPRPAVLFVIGFRDAGARAMLGCSFKEMESFVTWARLAAASGMTAVTYTTGEDPAADARAALGYVRDNAASLGVDAERIGLWGCSGHAPTALSLLTRDAAARLRCAVLCYGFMLDLGGSTAVADAASALRFANPCAGMSVDDLSPDTPLFVARAGRDEIAGVNASIDRFASEALARNLPLTIANHPTGPHAFDISDDGEASRAIVAEILAFLRIRLGA